MNSFIKYLEDNCPGDDAHSGYLDRDKPLLERCGMCHSIYEAHCKAIDEHTERLYKILNERADVEDSEYAIAALKRAASSFRDAAYEA